MKQFVSFFMPFTILAGLITACGATLPATAPTAPGRASQLVVLIGCREFAKEDRIA